MIALFGQGFGAAPVLFFAIVTLRQMIYLFFNVFAIKRQHGRGTLVSIDQIGTIVLHSVYIGAVVLAVYYVGLSRELDFLAVAGLLIILAGVVIRAFAMKELANYYSNDVTILKGHRLVTSGIYSLVRHPLYISLVAEVLGMLILSPQRWALLALLVALIGVLMRRIWLEDNILQRVFGRRAASYHQTVPSINLLKGVIRRLAKN